MNGFGAGLQGPLHPNAQELSVIGPGTHVEDVVAVPVAMRVALDISLFLVLVVSAVETALDIFLVLTPSHDGHDVDAITVLAPGLDPVGQPRINAINDGDIRTQVAQPAPRGASLEASAFEDLLGICGPRQRFLRSPREQWQQEGQRKAANRQRHEP
jgi:hypothetical protein